MKNQIEFRQLTPDFYNENNLVEMLDKGKDKGRGYGVLMVNVKGFRFAIPLRSKMSKNHKDNYTTKIYKENGKKFRHGLDYSKALIIKKEHYISKKPFFLKDKNDFVKIRKSQYHIVKSFDKYVTRYIQAVKNQDQNILHRYRYSTLQNYHTEFEL